jgi:hypothetical protein
MTPELRAIEDECRFVFVHLGSLVGLTTDAALVARAKGMGLQTRGYVRGDATDPGADEWEIFLMPATAVVDETAA